MDSSGINGLRSPGLSFIRLDTPSRTGEARSLAMAAHRAAATGDAGAAAAARQFQAVFLMEMLKPLTESLSRNPMAPDGAGSGSEIYDWFWREALATELTHGWPLPEMPGVAGAVRNQPGETVPITAADRFRGAPAPLVPADLSSRMHLPPSIRHTLSPPAVSGAREARAGTAPGPATQPGPPPAPSGPLPASPPGSPPGAGTAGLIDTYAVRAGRLFGVSPNLVRAVVEVESSWRTDAVSPRGAVGLMQLMPRTAAEMGVRDSTDAWQNMYGGTKYLSRQLERFGSLEKALAAYNAGPTAVSRHDGIPPYRETQNYVRRVIDVKARFDRQFPRDI